MKQGRNISFYIEIVIMLVISVLVISVCTAAFSKAESHSRSAKRLSDAVTLAASGAEVFLASDSKEDMFAVLNENGNASLGEEVTALYDDELLPSADGKMKMVISWEEAGGFVKGTVSVFYDGEKLYDLETGSAKEAGR
ncbi:MAG: hypothetical protein IKD64_05390 [Lachnospiraceae bacterium]|nr:hypothetical protein [Lachnospiraceae bacterium]